MKRLKHAAIFLCCCVLLTGAAFAHKVNVFAYVEEGKIYVESYFPDGKPVIGGAVEVQDSGNRVVAEGVTDEEGKCVLTIPVKDDLTIILNASMGHRSSYLLKKSDLGD